jgi:FkbM family methyltransferase
VLRPGMCFFDIGAYHGLYGLVAAKKMAGVGRVVMFEPSPRARRRIRIHLLLNRARAAVESLALSSRRGAGEFFLVLSGFTTVRKIRVETATLDDYCSENGIRQVDLIKIDVEGGEMEVFKGALRVLAESRPLLICEVLDWVTRPWGYEARDLVEYLEERGYEWFDFAADGRIMPHARRQAYPEIKNYLAVPREKRVLVQHLIAT